MCLNYSKVFNDIYLLIYFYYLEVGYMAVYQNKEFWDYLDKLVKESEIIIDRPKGSSHPKFPDYSYPLDYGYLENTSSMDGEGIDVWLGSEPSKKLDAIICTVDLIKKDSEIKLLIGCTQEEKDKVYERCNAPNFFKGILIERKI